MNKFLVSITLGLGLLAACSQTYSPYNSSADTKLVVVGSNFHLDGDQLGGFKSQSLPLSTECVPVLINPYSAIFGPIIGTVEAAQVNQSIDFLVYFENKTTNCDMTKTRYFWAAPGGTSQKLPVQTGGGLPLGYGKFTINSWEVYRFCTMIPCPIDPSQQAYRHTYVGVVSTPTSLNAIPVSTVYAIPILPSKIGSTQSLAIFMKRETINASTFNDFQYLMSLWDYGNYVRLNNGSISSIAGDPGNDIYMRQLKQIDSQIIGKFADINYNHNTEWYKDGFFKPYGDARWFFDSLLAINSYQKHFLGYHPPGLIPVSLDDSFNNVSAQSIGSNTNSSDALNSNSSNSNMDTKAATLCKNDGKCIGLGGLLFGSPANQGIDKWMEWDRNANQPKWNHIAIKIRGDKFMEAPGYTSNPGLAPYYGLVGGRVRKISLPDFKLRFLSFGLADINVKTDSKKLDNLRLFSALYAELQEDKAYDLWLIFGGLESRPKGQNRDFPAFYCTLLAVASWYYGAGIDVRPPSSPDPDTGIMTPNYIWQSTYQNTRETSYPTKLVIKLPETSTQ